MTELKQFSDSRYFLLISRKNSSRILVPVNTLFFLAITNTSDFVASGEKTWTFSN